MSEVEEKQAAPIFVTGSTMRHVLVMTSASSIGLLAMFAVDVVDMYFIALLGEQQLVAALGFAGTLLFFMMSVGIGLQIALGALVARAEGGGSRDEAGRLCSSSLWVIASVAVLLTALAWWLLPDLLKLLGASGVTLDYALSYTRIQLPAMPLMILAVSLSAGVRAVGDARRSMLATLYGAGVNALLDPLFIFYFDWGIEGAAWASVCARVVMFAYAIYALFFVHRLPQKVGLSTINTHLSPLALIAVPAVLTNLATPLGNSVVLRVMSEFGDSAVAAMAIMGRLAPLLFAAVFAVSGAVGPIVGQNAGARRYDRVRQTLRDASIFVLAYVGGVWLLLLLLADAVVGTFAGSETAADLLYFYIHFLVGFFALNGLLFVSNACFNNLGKAYLATLFNYAKVLLGVVPAVYIGADFYQARGVMVGEAVSMAAFGVLGMLSALMFVRNLEGRYASVSEVSAEASAEVSAEPSSEA